MPNDETPQGYRARAAAKLISVVSIVSAILLIPVDAVRYSWQRLQAVPAWLKRVYSAVLHRHVENIGLIGGLAITFGLSYGLYVLDPRTPSLSIATLQVVVLAPFLFFVALHVAIWTYKHLFPEQFKAFIRDLGQQINGTTLPPLEEMLPEAFWAGTRFNGPNPLQVAQFRLLYDNSNFKRKCVRYVLFALPLFIFFAAMLSMLHLVLNLQPH